MREKYLICLVYKGRRRTQVGSRNGKTTSLLNAWLIYSTLLFEFVILHLNNIPSYFS